MSLDQYVIHLDRCNRCGWGGFEKLATHAYCANCNYSVEIDSYEEQFESIPQWALQALESQTQETSNANS